uniref:S-layer homology domain-containing protein n=1 Tax=Vallitalea guaymasensis TaxID=1185412 RepID=UPI00272D8E09
KDTEAVPGLSNFEQVNEYKADTFNDVEDGVWYADSVKSCYELGIMNGKGDNQFAPKGFISVAEAIAMAARTNKIYAGLDSEIEKTGDNWYDGFVKYAVENNIIKEDQFEDYTRKITKAELSYLFAKSVPAEEFTAIQLFPLPDVDDDTAYSSEIYLLFNAGVVTGSDENATFHPTNNITRAEASSIINRVINPDSRKAL